LAESIVWRTRINTECKYLILRHCFETLNFIRVQLKTRLAQRALARSKSPAWARCERAFGKHVIMHDGYVRSSVVFSILAEEWPGVKEQLERFLRL